MELMHKNANKKKKTCSMELKKNPIKMSIQVCSHTVYLELQRTNT